MCAWDPRCRWSVPPAPACPMSTAQRAGATGFGDAWLSPLKVAWNGRDASTVSAHSPVPGGDAPPRKILRCFPASCLEKTVQQARALIHEHAAEHVDAMVHRRQREHIHGAA